MITAIDTELETGKNYLVVFDLPAMTPDMLQRISNSAEIRNAFIEEYQKSSDFDVLDSAAKNPRETFNNQFVAVVKIDAAISLKKVCGVLLSCVGVVTGMYMSIRFRFAEVTTVGI
jgi:hypothetical protein